MVEITTPIYLRHETDQVMVMLPLKLMGTDC